MASLFGGGKKEEKKKEEESKGGADAAPVEEEKKSSGGSVMTMKRGDYMIHVLVEQAKNLLVESGETVSPIVEINCLGVKKYTSA